MRRLLFTLLLFIPSLSSAEYYEWYLASNTPNFSFYILESSSPFEICNSVYRSDNLQTNPSFEFLSDDKLACTVILRSTLVRSGYLKRRGNSCPEGAKYDPSTFQCEPYPDPEEPEPDQCEAGNEVSHWKFIANNTLYTIPPTACLVGCTFSHTSSVPCYYPHTKNGQVGKSCKITFTGTGEECGGDSDSPPDMPDGDSEEPGPDEKPNEDCRYFVDEEGRQHFDCSPKVEPGTDGCPPGYRMQGTTCFRIPPDHPDYDPSTDPGDGSDGGEGDGEGGEGGGSGPGGDFAKEKTLQGIDKKLSGIESAIKTGQAQTAGLLQGIKDAIGNIPGGGGGGTKPGGGEGDGDGEGEGDGPELTAPDSGSFDEATDEATTEIEDLKTQIEAKFAEIKAFQVPGLSLSGGGGSLPVVTLNFGPFGSHQLDFNEFQQPLNMLAQLFVFICGVISLFIMFVRN